MWDWWWAQSLTDRLLMAIVFILANIANSISTLFGNLSFAISQDLGSLESKLDDIKMSMDNIEDNTSSISSTVLDIHLEMLPDPNQYP
ncbi:hypothetical protein D3C72_334490 [compost metagenome]